MIFNTFVMSETTYRQIKDLPPDQKLRFYDAIMEFGLYDKDPGFTGLELAAWIPMQDLIKNSKDKYTATCERNWQNINKRWHGNNGKAKDTTVYDGNNGNTKDTNVYHNDNDNDTTPPTPKGEVCRKRHHHNESGLHLLHQERSSNIAWIIVYVLISKISGTSMNPKAG